MHWYHIHGLAQDCSMSIANALEYCSLARNHGYVCLYFVWIKREYRLAHFNQFFNWFHVLSILLTDHPELRRTTQPSIMGGPLGDPGFPFFRSTEYSGTGCPFDKPLSEPMMVTLLTHLCPGIYASLDLNEINIIHHTMKNMHWKGPQMKFPDHTMSLYFKFLA